MPRPHHSGTSARQRIGHSPTARSSTSLAVSCTIVLMTGPIVHTSLPAKPSLQPGKCSPPCKSALISARFSGIYGWVAPVSRGWSRGLPVEIQSARCSSCQTKQSPDSTEAATDRQCDGDKGMKIAREEFKHFPLLLPRSLKRSLNGRSRVQRAGRAVQAMSQRSHSASSPWPLLHEESRKPLGRTQE